MRFTCDTCHTRYTLADEKVRGRVLKIRCRNCSAVMVVRDPALGPVEAPVPQQAAPAPAGWEQQATRSMPVAEARRLASETLAGAGATWENQATRSIPVAEAMRLARSAGVGAASEPIWYALRQGEQLGPMPREELAARVAAGELGPRNYVWREGMADWQRLQAVEELSDLLGGREAPTRLAPVFGANTPGPATFEAPTPGPAPAAAAAAPAAEARAGNPGPTFDVALDEGTIPAAGELDPAALFDTGTGAPTPGPGVAPHPAAGTWSPRADGPPPVVAAAGAQERAKGRHTLRIVLSAVVLAGIVAAAAWFFLPAGATAPAEPPPAAETAR